MYKDVYIKLYCINTIIKKITSHLIRDVDFPGICNFEFNKSKGHWYSNVKHFSKITTH